MDYPADNFLDPVAGHGTFIAGIIEQLTPGCTIRVERVFEPEGDVSTCELALRLWHLMATVDPSIVNFSFGGTGSDPFFESLDHWRTERLDVVFVAAAGNEGSCVEQYPAAMPSVIGVAGLGPTGPARVVELRTMGRRMRARHRPREFVLCQVRRRPAAHQRVRSDDFTQWATWSGTSFAAPVVVAALAREMLTAPGCTAVEAVDRVVRAPHLARAAAHGHRSSTSDTVAV